MELTDDGVLKVLSLSGQEVWSTLTAGNTVTTDQYGQQMCVSPDLVPGTSFSAGRKQVLLANGVDNLVFWPRSCSLTIQDKYGNPSWKDSKSVDRYQDVNTDYAGGPCSIEYTTDGNFTIKGHEGTNIWATKTDSCTKKGHAPGFIQLKPDGELMVYANDPAWNANPTGERPWLWRSNTPGHKYQKKDEKSSSLC